MSLSLKYSTTRLALFFCIFCVQAHLVLSDVLCRFDVRLNDFDDDSPHR